MIKRGMCSHCGLYFSSLKAKSLKESLKVVLKTQQSVCDPCDLLLIIHQRELLCVMALQEIEWASMDEVDAEDFDLSNITDDTNENKFDTPVFDTNKAVPIWSDETED